MDFQQKTETTRKAPQKVRNTKNKLGRLTGAKKATSTHTETIKKKKVRNFHGRALETPEIFSGKAPPPLGAL